MILFADLTGQLLLSDLVDHQVSVLRKDMRAFRPIPCSTRLPIFVKNQSPKSIPSLVYANRLQYSIASNAPSSDNWRAALAKPTWSVKSLAEPHSNTDTSTKITQKQLHHLLRLSALQLPKDEEEETKMIQTLESQLHFVQAIQSVDTTGIEPLQSIRDETEEAEKENMITLETMRPELEKEEVVGHSRRIRRKRDLLVDTKQNEDWDPLARAPKTLGRYIVVETGKT